MGSSSSKGQQSQPGAVARGLPWFGGLGEALSREGVKGGVTRRWGEGCSYQFSWACFPSAKAHKMTRGHGLADLDIQTQAIQRESQSTASVDRCNSLSRIPVKLRSTASTARIQRMEIGELVLPMVVLDHAPPQDTATR